jgi:hypothetical protein
MYENGKIRPVETLPGMGAEEMKVNSTMKYCKNLANVTMYPRYKNNFKKEK